MKEDSIIINDAKVFCEECDEEIDFNKMGVVCCRCITSKYKIRDRKKKK